MRRPPRPLDPAAVKAANEAVWKEFKLAPGTQLTMQAGDAKARERWMDVYLATIKKKDVPAPPPPAPEPATCQPTPVTELIKSTPKLVNLPSRISLAGDACKTMKKLADASIDKSGNSIEHAGTLATDSKGNLVVLNEKSGASGDCTPSTDVPKGYQYVGTFHTHPYGKNDGTWDGANLPFSDDDFGTLDDYKENVSAVQSGSNIYVLVKTDKSSNISSADAKSEYDKVFDPEYAALKKAGKSDADAASGAGEKATGAVAKKYKYGYYRGTDCGELSRVNP